MQIIFLFLCIFFLKFRNEGERSLLSAITSFGEVTVNVPSRLSFSLGSDPEMNDVEIHRAMQAPHGRRRTGMLKHTGLLSTRVW